MNQEDVNTYMTLGLQTGIYMVASVLAETEPHWLKLKQQAADDIQRVSGMPAEDFANHMDGMLQSVKRDIERARGER